MSSNLTHTKDFQVMFAHIQQARHKVFTQVNTALIDLYWHIGETISQKVKDAGWGKGVVSELARFIAEKDPALKGFSDKNLWRMKQFYETYQEDEKLATLWRELSWSHNRMIMTLKNKEERAFYLHLTVNERLSVRDLERQIAASAFERTMLGNKKLSPLLRELHPTISNSFKDSYVLATIH